MLVFAKNKHCKSKNRNEKRSKENIKWEKREQKFVNTEELKGGRKKRIFLVTGKSR